MQPYPEYPPTYQSPAPFFNNEGYVEPTTLTSYKQNQFYRSDQHPEGMHGATDHTVRIIQFCPEYCRGLKPLADFSSGDQMRQEGHSQEACAEQRRLNEEFMKWMRNKKHREMAGLGDALTESTTQTYALPRPAVLGRAAIHQVNEDEG
jgi:hypothetical protein